MKLSDIKTVDQFWAFADVWYKRTLNLAYIWQDDNETQQRRYKAFCIWNHYRELVLKLTSIAQKFNVVNVSYPKGGITQN
ncbi:hypothetical protein [Elizabethkingia meningoseptica]|uniref:hypothetical protein n=1 Tax=Elizabethkingia meningoseptica TaxID=238 RepID=UPI00389299EB